MKTYQFALMALASCSLAIVGCSNNPPQHDPVTINPDKVIDRAHIRSTSNLLSKETRAGAAARQQAYEEYLFNGHYEGPTIERVIPELTVAEKEALAKDAQDKANAAKAPEAALVTAPDAAPSKDRSIYAGKDRSIYASKDRSIYAKKKSAKSTKAVTKKVVTKKTGADKAAVTKSKATSAAAKTKKTVSKAQRTGSLKVTPATDVKLPDVKVVTLKPGEEPKHEPFTIYQTVY